MAEVAIREVLEAGHPTLMISTWSCYYCQISPVSSEPEARDQMRKTWAVRQLEVVVAAVVVHSPSCYAPVEVVVAVSPPVGEATSEVAFRD